MNFYMDNNSNSFINSLKVSQEQGIPISPIQEQQKALHEITNSYLDTYEEKNSLNAKKYMCYLTAAIYITYKKMYPNLVIRIPFRTKSDTSYQKNIQKEFPNSLDTLIEQLEKNNESLTLETLEKYFPTEPTTKDIQAATIILDHFKEPILLTYQEGEYDNPLPNVKNNDIDLKESITDLVNKDMKYTNLLIKANSIYSTEFLSEFAFLMLKKQILEGIIDLNYHGFDGEKYPSYQEDLKSVEEKIANGVIQQNFAASITNLQKYELKHLISNMQYLLEDKLQFNILNNTISNVLNQPIVKNTLQATYDYSKTSKKSNGFAAIYYTLHTPYGDIELFLQSNERYYQSKKGSAFHSGMSGKSLDIKDFFEYVNPENETEDLNYFLDSIDLPVSVLDDTKNQKLAESINQKLSRIKIKDSIDVKLSVPTSVTFDSTTTKKDPESLKKKQIADEKIKNAPTVSINTNEYLYLVATSRSACLNTCSSGHSFSINAAIHHQDIDDEFAEVLRRRDSMTCLGNILLKRLRIILKTSKADDKTNINKINSISSLPKLISPEEIYEYGEELENLIENTTPKDTEKTDEGLEI